MATSSPTARLTLGQMRRSTGRLMSAGVAIAIGTAFVAATLLAGNIISGTTYDQVAAQYADSDLVVLDDTGSLTAADVEAARATDGVVAADARHLSFAELNHGGKTVYQGLVAVASDPRLSPLEVSEGAFPDAAGEIAIPEDVATRLGVGVGDEISSTRWITEAAPMDAEAGTESDAGAEAGAETDAGAEQTESREVVEQLTVTGIVQDPYSAYGMMGGAAVVTQEVLQDWLQAEYGSEVPSTDSIAVATEEPGDAAAVEAIREALATSVPNASSVSTTEDYAAQQVASMSGGQDLMFLVFVMTFAAVSLVVAGLVIANTFQVLVAQRSRTLALLRCVGAGTGQLYRSVLLEAAILGVISSAVGIVAGCLLVQGALLVAPNFDLGVPLPQSITLSAPVFLVPLAVGVLVTLVAALAPARAASRVAPLAALRPAEAPSLRSGAGRARAVLATLATVGGFAALAGGTAFGLAGRADVGLLAAVLGGSVSLIGVIIGAVFWLPKVAAGFGRLIGSAGPAARLAAANTLRNPRRTAATSTALLIGVTLVSMMTTGAASARNSMDNELSARYPVDIQVETTASDAEGRPTGIPDVVTGAVTGVDGLRAMTQVTSTWVDTTGEQMIPVVAVSQGSLGSVVNTPDTVDGLQPGSLLVPDQIAEGYGLEDGATVELSGSGGDVTLDVVHSELRSQTAYLTPDDLAAIEPDLQPNQIWAGVADGHEGPDVVAAVQDAVSTTDEAVEVTGAVVQRSTYTQIIDVILGIVVGLLGVAVIIALIGVANTLSLSVIERTRENAMLRAIGLSKAQLRTTLAIEGMLIAGVGAVLGVVLGLLYGWAGAVTALSSMGDVPLAVPWTDVALIIGIALVAGLIASVVPARAAVRTHPVAALAAE